MPNPNNPPDADKMCDVQLSLFGDGSPSPVRGRQTISRAAARAAVPPGWWPLISGLFGEPRSTSRPAEGSAHLPRVTMCKVVDGALVLRATTSTGAPMEAALASLCRVVHGVCGACGRGRARPYRPTFGAPICIVCGTCLARLQAGESLLRIADDFFRLDGSRRNAVSRPIEVAVPHDEIGNAITGRQVRFAPTMGSAPRAILPLPAADLRQLVLELRTSMRELAIGQDAAVARLTILAALHVGGGLARGQRALVVGPSGCGKTTLLVAMHRALRDAGYSLPLVTTDAIELSAPGWSGAPSIGDLIKHALGALPPQGELAKRAIVIIDELHHIGITNKDLQGNSLTKRQEVLASMLCVFGHGELHLGGEATTWSSEQALVIGAGAFTGLLDTTRPIGVDHLVRAGIPLELASRLAEEVIQLQPLSEGALRQLLSQWPALTSLTAVAARLGISVRIHNEAIARAARAAALGHGGATVRTAGGWLVTAMRRALDAALDASEGAEIEITPDCLSIAPELRQPPSSEEPPYAGAP